MELVPAEATITFCHQRIPRQHGARHASNGPTFTHVWEGDWEGKYPSQSEADLALCCHLAFWTRLDPSRIDVLFRQPGLYRKEKWERTDYRDRTIAAALERTRDVYDPGTVLTTGLHPILQLVSENWTIF